MIVLVVFQFSFQQVLYTNFPQSSVVIGSLLMFLNTICFISLPCHYVEVNVVLYHNSSFLTTFLSIYFSSLSLRILFFFLLLFISLQKDYTMVMDPIYLFYIRTSLVILIISHQFDFKVRLNHSRLYIHQILVYSSSMSEHSQEKTRTKSTITKNHNLLRLKPIHHVQNARASKAIRRRTKFGVLYRHRRLKSSQRQNFVVLVYRYKIVRCCGFEVTRIRTTLLKKNLTINLK